MSEDAGTDLEASLLSFEKLDRASPDLWPEQLPGVAEFAASFKSPITSSPPKWMAEIERDDIDMLKELGSLTTANLMEKVRGLQNLAYQLGLDECHPSTNNQPRSCPTFQCALLSTTLVLFLGSGNPEYIPSVSLEFLNARVFLIEIWRITKKKRFVCIYKVT
ncbi:protein lin-52 homolog isoform X2 [Canis lupus familiaris]|uniref:protein lin-52 homolog isoform X2 n=2 Tax=Canis lupus familiaris TaxID=9615 RepID=UPI0018F5DFDC|nr:protein lin-52 homolog isoform X2 [Canis lupus familiaris]XP_038446997.1 protein lin-52 homolog isoform X2 [Canis lupus familiaris]XP_038530104.1 protein lin-52 homolog isoform X2 [Canis lupus familiaris]